MSRQFARSSRQSDGDLRMRDFAFLVPSLYKNAKSGGGSLCILVSGL